MESSFLAVEIFWKFWQIWQFFNFQWQLTMTIFYDNFWTFDNVDNFDNFDHFWHFFTIFFTIFDIFFTIFDNFESFCDLKHDTWDTDYISDNWEQQNEQLHCDLWIESDGDSIRNSCDVLFFHKSRWAWKMVGK